MKTYLRTPLANTINVTAIINARYHDIRGRKVPGESHDFPELFYVYRGKETTCVDGVEHNLQAGQLLLYAPNSFHGYEIPAVGTSIVGNICFHCEGEDLSPLYHQVITLTEGQKQLFHQIINDSMLYLKDSSGKNRLIGMTPKKDTTLFDLQVIKNTLELLLHQLLSQVKGNEKTHSNREKQKKLEMNRLRLFLTEHLTDNFTCDEIAMGVEISTSKLRRLVYEMEGCGPLSYFLSLKIEESKRLLRTSPMNVGEIAEHLGFQSISYFSKLFKKKTGKSPSSYTQ